MTQSTKNIWKYGTKLNRTAIFEKVSSGYEIFWHFISVRHSALATPAVFDVMFTNEMCSSFCLFSFIERLITDLFWLHNNTDEAFYV